MITVIKIITYSDSFVNTCNFKVPESCCSSLGSAPAEPSPMPSVPSSISLASTSFVTSFSRIPRTILHPVKFTRVRATSKIEIIFLIFFFMIHALLLVILLCVSFLLSSCLTNRLLLICLQFQQGMLAKVKQSTLL